MDLPQEAIGKHSMTSLQNEFIPSIFLLFLHVKGTGSLKKCSNLSENQLY